MTRSDLTQPPATRPDSIGQVLATHSPAVSRDNSLVYSRLLELLRQRAEIRRMFVWRNGTQQLHFCSQWDAQLGSVKNRLERIEKVANQKRMVVTALDGDAAPTSDLNQQAVAIFRGFADSSVLELHALVSSDAAKMTEEITVLEKALQPFADAVSAEAAEQAIESHPLARPRINQQSYEQNHGLIDFFSQINSSLNRTETAFNVVNELRRECDCDRVSLLSFAQVSRAKLVTSSGVAKVNRKGRETILLEQLVTRVCHQNQVFAYPTEDFYDIPVAFRDQVEEYLTHSSTRYLMIVPVHLDQSSDASASDGDKSLDRKHGAQPARLISAIVIENFHSSELTPATQQYHETLALCAGDAYGNAFRHQRAFLFPLWEFLGKQYDFFIGRYFSRTMTAVIASAVLIACSFFIHGDYRLSCDGQLLPAEFRTVWAELDGIVSEIHAQTGQQVAAGDRLLTLENKDLTVRQQEYSGNLFSLRQRLDSVDRLLTAEASDFDEENQELQRLSVERASLVQQVETTEKQLQIVDEQLQAQEIVSPIAGVLLTSDLQKELQDRPVSQGTSLVDVANVDGEWQLELKLPDRKIGELLKANEASDEPLQVSFVRSSEPSISYQGTIKEIDMSAQIDDEVGQFLRITVDFDQSKIPHKNVGVEAVAYVHCGQQSYAYIWTKEISDFFHKHVIFPLF